MGHVALDRVRVAAGGRTLLDDVTLDARPGELIAIVGSNGVGKTTLLRAIAGLGRPAAGRIAVDGTDVHAMRARERARAIAFIGTDVETPDDATVSDVVALGRFAYRAWWDWSEAPDDRVAASLALARVGCARLATRAIATLSSGERQRVWLALALAQDAGLVLLDEPTSHLDPRHALDVTCTIRGIASDRTTAFVTSHDLNEAATIADRIAVLGEGRLLACAPPDVALDPALLERAFGIAFDRVDVDGAARVVARGYRRAATAPTRSR